MPATGIAAPSISGSASPTTHELGTISGSIEAGMPKMSRSSSSHLQVSRLQSIVREAFVISVTKTRPPVSFQMSHVSIVPKASSPRSARARAPGTLSRIQRILVAEKYGSMRRPVFSRTSTSKPLLCSSVQ